MALEPCCLGRGVAAVRHRSRSSSYTHYAIREIQPSIAAFEDDGTVFGAINKEAFGRLKILKPTAEAINAFECTVSSLDDRIKQCLTEIEYLGQLRDTLLPKLISGELRIKGANGAVEAA